MAGHPVTKQTFHSPPNQIVLATYPNGRPGALRELGASRSSAAISVTSHELPNVRLANGPPDGLM